MQLCNWTHDNTRFPTAERAFQAASDWMTAQGDEDCTFIVRRLLGTNAWTAKVLDANGDLRGFVFDPN